MNLPQIETPSPLHGAAWLVIYGHIQPIHVTDPGKVMMAKARMNELRSWATGTGDAELTTAYLWALDSIERAIDQQMAVMQLGGRVMAATRTIPMPPGVDAEPWMKREVQRETPPTSWDGPDGVIDRALDDHPEVRASIADLMAKSADPAA